MNVNNYFIALLSTSCLTVLPISSSALASELETKFSGYARIVAGILDESDTKYANYSNELSLDKQSLIGLQGQVIVNKQLSVTGLGLLHSNPDVDSGVEWLYVNYRPTSAINIKAGQMQTPFYALSDVLDVGYSYPWVTAPKEVYNDFIFKRFKGLDIRYSHIAEDYSAHIEAYYGIFDDTLIVNNVKTPIEADHLSGIITELKINNFNLRASYHSAEISLNLPSLNYLSQTLSLSGFEQEANTFKIHRKDTEFYQFSAHYDSLNYFVKSEFVNIKPDAEFYADIQGYLLSYGRYFGDFTLLASYGNRKDKLKTIDNSIPLGIAPQLDQLYFVLQGAIDNRTKDDSESYSIGLRWDFKENLAFKSELKHVKAHSDQNSFLKKQNPADTDNTVNLLSFAIEWVF